MTRRACGTAVAILLFNLAPAAWGQQLYLYSPKPVGADEKAQAGEGVLVQEIPIQKGDTLYQLSRKFSGHGSYYSQILLFNDIKNPNLIYAGDTLKVPLSNEKVSVEERKAPARKKKKSSAHKPPKSGHKTHIPATTSAKKPVPRKSAEPQIELPLSELKRLDKSSQKPPRDVTVKPPQKPAPVAEKRRPTTMPAEELRQPAIQESSSDQQLFERAVKAYRQEDCRTALDLFEAFIAKNPSSPLAADASLYKAECYLKLSVQ